MSKLQNVEHPKEQHAGHSGVCYEYNQFMVCGTLFECPSKYAPIKPIGKGAYGVVCSARNLETNEKLAIKKIANCFNNAVDAKRILREVALLSHLKHENIIALRDLVPPADPSNYKDVYLVYELMDTDLHQIIRSPQQLSPDHISYFIYQVLRGLKYIHSSNILHRDLKPSNLLVNANCDLKICDFGLARAGSIDEHVAMTEYVVTRWYRAPELLLSCNDYTAAIDVWSVACIMAELLGRKPLFPGKDYVQQLDLITKVSRQFFNSLVTFLLRVPHVWLSQLCQEIAAQRPVMCAAQRKQQLLSPVSTAHCQKHHHVCVYYF
eukprot:GHUV01027824.1.p1 GENE.GHUV01027824.1~~GHUV01027824.1.p1  ORF type:complete len:322 (+),score=71.18 GHUV01027824.1:492-1457(+)